MTHKQMARINGADLYVETAGSGYPLVWIHGFSLDGRMWDDQFEAFARHYRVVRYDLRGFGRSSLPDDAPYSHAEDLVSLMEHLGIEQAALAGFSMGAEIALGAALSRPAMVDALVLAGTYLQGYAWQTFGQAFKRVIDIGRASGAAAARAVWLDQEIFQPAMEKASARSRLQQIVADYSGWHFTNKDPRRRPVAPVIKRLDQIDTKALVAVGTDDLTDYQALAELVQQQMPQAVGVEIPGSGHLIPMEAAAAFNDHVKRFLDDTIGT